MMLLRFVNFLFGRLYCDNSSKILMNFMPDNFSDLNISIGWKTAEQISFFASQQHRSLDDMVKQLIERGIEDAEDERLGLLAMERKHNNTEPYINHEDAWK